MLDSKAQVLSWLKWVLLNFLFCVVLVSPILWWPLQLQVYILLVSNQQKKCCLSVFLIKVYEISLIGSGCLAWVTCLPLSQSDVMFQSAISELHANAWNMIWQMRF